MNWATIPFIYKSKTGTEDFASMEANRTMYKFESVGNYGGVSIVKRFGQIRFTLVGILWMC